MIIANPLFDIVFKKLMEDEWVAKFFIGTLLDETIEELNFRPQEYINSSKMLGFAVYRLDFVCVIRTASGEKKKVLIEVQKAKNYKDLMRFRNYLGENYKKYEVVETAGEKKLVSLPITTIYLLGFKLAGVESAAVKVARQYIDLINNKLLQSKSDFIEQLTHDTFVIQMPRIEGKMHSKLDKLLTVFEQKYFADERGLIKQYNYDIDEEVIQRMINILHYVGTEPEEKKELESEQELWRTFEHAVIDVTENYHRLICEREEVIGEQTETIREQTETIKEQAEMIKQLEFRINSYKS